LLPDPFHQSRARSHYGQIVEFASAEPRTSLVANPYFSAWPRHC